MQAFARSLARARSPIISFVRKHLPPILHNAVGQIIAFFVLLGAGSLAVFSSRFRAFVTSVATRDFLVPGWLIVILGLCGALTVLETVRWLVSTRRPELVRLFRSLSHEDQSILRCLAR